MFEPKNTKNVQNLKNHAKNFGIFANLETLGSYDDFSQVVCLDYLDEKTFSQLFEAIRKSEKRDSTPILQENYNSIVKFFSTCTHELTHWLDHTATLWGQRQLIFIYNAINAWTSQDEQEFYRIVIANSERARARLSTYYTEKYNVNSSNHIDKPWQYEYSTGLEFGIDGIPRKDRPILFTTFYNSDNERVIRVPLSMMSLTEVTATYAELQAMQQGLSLLDKNSRLVEESRIKEEKLENLYNSELAIYSVAVHCLSNSIKIYETIEAYKFSSALATLCLNLPEDLFSSLNVPEDLYVWGERIQSFKDIADPGFAFFIIARQAPEYRDNMRVEEWLQEALKNSGLPDLEKIKSLAEAKLEELKSRILQGKYSEQLKLLLLVGRKNFIERGVWGENILSIKNLYKTSMILPPIVLGDSFVTPITQNTIPISPQSMNNWIDQIVEIESRISKFVNACRF
jgi:hypothetical protein